MIIIFTNVSKKQAYIGLAIIFLVTTFFGSQIRHLSFNDNFDLFFPEGDSDLAYYLKITDEFGVYNNYLLIALKGNDVYKTPFLSKTSRLTEVLSKLPETETVLSPTNYKQYQITPLSVNSFNVIPKGRDLAPAAIKENERIYGQFFGKDDSSVGLVLRHKNFENKKFADAFYLRLIDILKKSGFDDFVVSGKVQAQYDFSIRLKNELGRLLAIAVLLVILMLTLVFRSFRGVAIPLLSLLITLIWMVGFFGLMRKPVDILSIMIPPILLVVSMSDVIHLCNRFNDHLAKGVSVPEAMKKSIRHVGLATLFTSVTTAIGFFSLIVSPVSPIKNFGIYTGIGVVFAFIVIFVTIPCFLVLMNKGLNAKSNRLRTWHLKLNAVFRYIIAHRKSVVALSLLALVLGMAGSYMVKKNTYIFVGVGKEDPLTKAVQYFDKFYDGSRPFEMTFTLKESDFLFTSETLKKLEGVHNYLKTNYGVNHIESPLSVIKSINQALNGGVTTAYKLPDQIAYAKIQRLYNSGQFKEIRSGLQSEDGKVLRINGRMSDIGSKIAREKNKALHSFMSDSLGLEREDYRLTGTSYLIDKTDDYIVSSILKGLVIAIIIVSILIRLITGSWYIMFVAVLVNLLPLVVLGGIMGFLGVDLNIATAVIFSIAFGIAVDDSIHFIVSYQIEARKKVGIAAIKGTYFSTGKSILLTTLILSSGFAVFLFSGFSTTFYIGLFAAITFILAVLADMILLPALLTWKK